MIGLVLAGGTGSRFWPLSRRRRPKQLLDLLGGGPLLAATARRVAPLCGEDGIWVCTTRGLAVSVAETLPGVPASRILGEPVGRNTGPAIGWAVRSLPTALRDDVVAVLPSDHWVADEAAFREALERGAAAVERGDFDVVTVGIAPAWAETGYGYLELAAPVEPFSLEKVLRFTEKPDAATAAAFQASGRHFWNGGIFLFRGTVLLDLYRRHLPGLLAGLERLMEDGVGADRRRELYADLESVSIDHGLMERVESIGCVVADCGWTDLGSWAALAECLPSDDCGNSTVGETFVLDARDNLLFADEGAIAVVGVEGLAVVRTGDAVLVVPRERTQDVRAVVELLRSRNRQYLL